MTVDEFDSQVQQWLEGFNFLRPGDEGSLGRDIAMGVVERIQQRASDEQRGAGEPWQENAPKYAAWKQKRYKVGQKEPNVRTGQMLDQLSLYGRTTIEPELITMVYGIDKLPDRTRNGVPLPTYTRGKHEGEQIDNKTDVEKAYYAHTGQSKQKILRPFYEMDEEMTADVMKIIATSFSDYCREANSR